MTHRFARLALAFSLLALAVPATAHQTSPAVPPAAAPVEDLVPVVLETGLGRIVIALDRGRAPKTVANFLAYVDAKAFDGESFYRAMPYGDGGLIQAGITSDARKLKKPVPFESTRATGLSNVAGTIAMAATSPGNAQSDFFIMTTDITSFDGDSGFAAFGHVIEGMDIVKKIFAAPVSPTKGEGSMKGQMLEPRVKIGKAARLP